MRALPVWALKQLRDLVDNALEQGPPSDEVIKSNLRAEIDRCLSPSPGSKSRRAKQAKKRTEKRLTTDEIYRAVAYRAGGECECGCGAALILGTAATPQLDHFFSRRFGQSVSSCWMLAATCHRAKTDNYPSARAWLERYRAHCVRWSFWVEAAKAGKRLDYLNTKSRLTKRRSA